MSTTSNLKNQTLIFDKRFYFLGRNFHSVIFILWCGGAFCMGSLLCSGRLSGQWNRKTNVWAESITEVSCRLAAFLHATSLSTESCECLWFFNHYPSSIIGKLLFLRISKYFNHMSYSGLLCFKHINLYCEALCKIKSHHQHYPHLSGVKKTVGAVEMFGKFCRKPGWNRYRAVALLFSCHLFNYMHSQTSWKQKGVPSGTISMSTAQQIFLGLVTYLFIKYVHNVPIKSPFRAP